MGCAHDAENFAAEADEKLAQGEDFWRDLQSRPDSETPQIVAWLETNANRLYPPYLFELARRLQPTDPERALYWADVAYVRTRYDSLLCRDQSAQQIIVNWALYVKEVLRYEKGEPARGAEMLRQSLAWDEEQPLAGPAGWTCGHGIKDYTKTKDLTADELLIPEDEWPAKREEARSEFETDISRLETAARRR